MSRAAGFSAEQLAAAHLQERGFRILESNFTVKGGEIDLVCDDGGTLVFVEVRARRGRDYGTPEETISPTKRRRILLAARHYLVRRGVSDRACRFDVVAIEGDQIRHLVDAFSATT
jgi:putative endonuclease